MARDTDPSVQELTKKYHAKCLLTFCRRVLFTYYNIKDFLNWTEFVVDHNSAEGVDVMLDSGAFSIWREGKGTGDLEGYIDFSLTMQEESLFKSLVFVSLDKIPGTVTRPATVKELNEAVEESLKNYKLMKERGVRNVLYVYHLGEPIDWLGKVLDEGATYIGLGGLARGAGSGARRRWLESVFSYLQNYPKVKTHGFGITASNLVLGYPWYSVDAITPFLWPGLGSVPVFDEKHEKIVRRYVSDVSKREKVHPADKKFLEDRWGVTFDQLKEVLWLRRYFSLLEWDKFEKHVQKKQQSEKPEKFQQSILGGSNGKATI